ncbi:MAG: WGR domain-containing protein, partial [Proteobacteria bacterium]|nr:WGR domain-containing protein [Pseudomonadota bacterium]
MARYELIEGTSSKFWEIELTGSSFTTTYGKIGTSGQSATKSFDSDEKARKEHDKIVAEKVKKGYKAVGTKEQSESKKDEVLGNAQLVEKLNKAPNLQKALVEHFIDLADSPNSKPVLEAIMAKAESVSLSGKSLIIHFQDDQEMSVSGPLDNVDTDYAAYPKSFRAVMKKYGALSFPDDGWAIHLCDSGNFEVEMLEDVDSELLEYVDDPSEILCPLTDYSDWWIYHPKEKNPQGEPALCYISHEGGDVEEGDT